MVVTVENIVKHFGRSRAVDGVSFTVGEAEVLSLLGPNGAGKTTTIHLLLGLITPDQGQITVFGKNLRTSRQAILQDVNFTSPYVALPYRLTVLENLKVFAHLYHVPAATARIKYLLELFQIDDLKHKPTGRLSAGESTRVGLCKALLNRPKLLLLDEPTASLDPDMARQARELLLKAQREEGTTILYTSHNMAEVERLCTRIIFLNHGKVVASGTPVEITRAILQEERHEPALEEVFFRVASGTNL